MIKRQVLMILFLLLLSACAAVDNYIRLTSKQPSLLIGYQTVALRDDIQPDVEILFPDSSSVINDKAIEEIGGALNTSSYFVVEATAGGYSKGSQKIARDRVSSIISVLESFGISSNKIYVAEYAGDKIGRRGYLYSVSY